MKLVSTKIYFIAIREIYALENNPLYGSIDYVTVVEGLELPLNQIPEFSLEVMRHCKGSKMTQKMGKCL
jgi:hypothetical protein